jgi:hypothetical protein
LDPTATTTARLFAGVDVSKDRLDVCLRWSEPQRHEKEEAFVVAYDDSGIDALLCGLLEERSALVVLEATGGFERTVVGALAAAGLPVVVVNPPQVRDFARATGTLANTDRIDAAILARFAEAVRPTPKPLPDREIRALQAIVARRRQLLGMIAAENNRLARHPSRWPNASRLTSGGSRRSSPAPKAISGGGDREQPRPGRERGATAERARGGPGGSGSHPIGRGARAGHTNAQASGRPGGGRPPKPRLGHPARPS